MWCANLAVFVVFLVILMKIFRAAKVNLEFIVPKRYPGYPNSAVTASILSDVSWLFRTITVLKMGCFNDECL